MWKFDFNCIKKCLPWTLNVTSINPFTLEDLTSHYRLSSYMLSEKDTKFLSWQCELQPGIEHEFCVLYVNGHRRSKRRHYFAFGWRVPPILQTEKSCNRSRSVETFPYSHDMISTGVRDSGRVGKKLSPPRSVGLSRPIVQGGQRLLSLPSSELTLRQVSSVVCFIVPVPISLIVMRTEVCIMFFCFSWRDIGLGDACQLSRLFCWQVQSARLTLHVLVLQGGGGNSSCGIQETHRIESESFWGRKKAETCTALDELSDSPRSSPRQR
jgi:hypothetical protein